MSDSVYDSMVQSILNYYSSDSDIWNRVATGQATAAEIHNAFSYIPQVKLDKSISGATLGVSYADPLSKMTVYSDVDDIINSINSNDAGHSYGNNGFTPNIPANFSQDQTTGNYIIKSGSSSGASTLATVADRASLAVTGVNIGCKLGKFIDQTLYDLAPDWWDEHLPSINPETWNNLCGQSDVGDFFLRTLFDVTPNGTTGYISEEVLAYYYQMLRDNGAWSTPGATDTATSSILPSQYSPVSMNNTSDYLTYNKQGHIYTRNTITIANSGGRVALFSYYDYMVGTSKVLTIMASPASTTATQTTTVYDSNMQVLSTVTNTYSVGTQYTSGGKTVYYGNIEPSAQYQTDLVSMTPFNRISATPTAMDRRYISWTMIFGDITHPQPATRGISDISGATQYPPTNITGTTTADVLSQLKQEYPDLFTDAIKETTLQDDGTLTETSYVPIPWVTEGLDTTNPTTDTDADPANPEVKPDTMTDILLDTTDPTTPDTGDGNGPTPIIPTGNASSLWAIYHPSQAQLDAFGAWLWSSDFVDQIKRLFADPMQAIIGVHKVYAPIPTGGAQNIKCGYLDSGVSSPTVSSQYTEVNCGTVSCPEYFGGVFDYDPYTKVSIYLPFIGVVPLKTAEVMRSSVTVTYGVDVITGACLAKVNITRDGCGGILYSYGGSCACHYPVSSGSYAGIVSGIATSALGIATGIATGSPLAAVGGVVAGLRQARVDVQHSGGFTGCAGAMGPKKPYLIITRPQTRVADGVESFDGLPSNSNQLIGNCTGFVKVSSAHVKSSRATDPELAEITDYLKSGIII